MKAHFSIMTHLVVILGVLSICSRYSVGNKHHGEIYEQKWLPWPICTHWVELCLWMCFLWLSCLRRSSMAWRMSGKTRSSVPNSRFPARFRHLFASVLFWIWECSCVLRKPSHPPWNTLSMTISQIVLGPEDTTGAAEDVTFLKDTLSDIELDAGLDRQW